ncbi:hypothetical protein ACVWZN_001563 [Lysobacter sp. HA35]
MTASKPLMSSEQYASADGTTCPVCGGPELDRAPMGYPETGRVTAWVGCETCKHVWQEQYRLEGYDRLEKSSIPPQHPSA